MRILTCAIARPRLAVQDLLEARDGGLEPAGDLVRRALQAGILRPQAADLGGQALDPFALVADPVVDGGFQLGQGAFDTIMHRVDRRHASSLSIPRSALLA